MIVNPKALDFRLTGWNGRTKVGEREPEFGEADEGLFGGGCRGKEAVDTARPSV